MAGGPVRHGPGGGLGLELTLPPGDRDAVHDCCGAVNQTNRNVSYHGWVTWAAAAVSIVVFVGLVAGVFRRRRRRPQAITPDGFRRALDVMSPDAHRLGEETTNAPTAPSIEPGSVRIAAKRPTAKGTPEQDGG